MHAARLHQELNFKTKQGLDSQNKTLVHVLGYQRRLLHILCTAIKTRTTKKVVDPQNKPESTCLGPWRRGVGLQLTHEAEAAQQRRRARLAQLRQARAQRPGRLARRQLGPVAARQQPLPHLRHLACYKLRPYMIKGRG